jgi:hypothetical protein
MHFYEPTKTARLAGNCHTLLVLTFPWVWSNEGGDSMNIGRKVAMVLAATGLSLGLLGISAPAQADTSWGCGGYGIRGGR